MTILLLETIDPEAHALLSGSARVLLAEDSAEALAVARQEQVEAVITRGRGQIRRPLLEASPALRLAARVGVGLDNIDVDAASELGIRVVNNPGSTTIATAEQAMTLMALLVRGLYPSVHAVKSGDWESRRTYRGDDLASKRIGIVGLGDIGSRVARLAAAYDMEVAYWSRRPRADAPYPYLPLPELLTGSDVVSLHVALTPETHHLLGPAELASMKPGAYLVNTARGQIVNQSALLAALDAGSLAGFAADVLDPEPPDPADPILRHPKAIITPHIAALTGDTFKRMSLRTARNVLAALHGELVEPGCIANENALAARGNSRQPAEPIPVPRPL